MAGRQVLQKSFLWKVIQFATSLALNISIVHTLGASLAGEFYFLIYFLALFVGFFTFGLDVSINVFLTKQKINATQALNLGGIITLLGLLVSQVFVYFYHYRFEQLSKQLMLLQVVSFLFVAGSLSNVFFNAILTSREKNFFINRTIVWLNLLLIACILIFRPVYAIKMIAVLYCSFIVLQALVNGVYCLRRFGEKKVFQLPEHSVRKQLLLFSGTSFVANFFFLLAPYITLSYVKAHYPAPVSGNFLQAFKVMEIVGFLFASAYYPFVTLVSQGKQRMEIQVLFIIRVINFLVLLFAIAFVLIGEAVVPLVFGKSYNQLYPVFLLLLPGLFAVSASSFSTAYFYGVNKAKTNLVSSVFQLLSLAMFFTAIPDSHDIRIIALYYSISIWLSFAFDLYMLRREYAYKWNEILLPGKKDLVYLFGLLKKSKWW